MILEVKNLGFSYGDTTIVQGVNLEVHEKEFIGLIGPNGSGKSTVLKCIYRVLRENQGEILLNGKPLRSYSLKESARHMAVVSQSNDFSFDFTVFDMVMMGRSPYKKFLEPDNQEDVRIVNDALEKVGLVGFEKRKMSELSGGEKQRIILARAIAQQVELLILDEPTNHLDIHYQMKFMELIESMNVTALCAVHDLNLALSFCDRIYALKDHGVYASGKPEDVITPSFMKDVYNVNAKILNDDVGNKCIMFERS